MKYKDEWLKLGHFQSLTDTNHWCATACNSLETFTHFTICKNAIQNWQVN